MNVMPSPSRSNARPTAPDDAPQSPTLDDVEFIDDGPDSGESRQQFPVDLDEDERDDPLGNVQPARTRHNSQPIRAEVPKKPAGPRENKTASVSLAQGTSTKGSGSLDLGRTHKKLHRSSAASLSELQQSRGYTFL